MLQHLEEFFDLRIHGFRVVGEGAKVYLDAKQLREFLEDGVRCTGIRGRRCEIGKFAQQAGTMKPALRSRGKKDAVQPADLPAFQRLRSQIANLGERRLIGGAFQNATLWASGGVGTAKIGSMSGSNIYLGVDPNGTTSPGGFIQVSTLGSLVLTGPGNAFYDSNIGVPRISSLRLGKVADVVTTQFQFGIQANFIGSYVRKTKTGGSIQYRKLTAPGVFDNVGTAFSAQIV